MREQWPAARLALTGASGAAESPHSEEVELIAGDVGGIPEYARDEFSYLLAPHDVAGLAAALDELAADRVLADEMGRAGWEMARTTFSPDRFHERVMSVYGRAAEQVKRGIVEAAP